MTKGKMTGLVMIVVLVLSASVVRADNGNGGNFASGQSGGQSAPSQEKHEWKHGKMKGKFFHHLNLTEEQKKQLEGNWQKEREAMKIIFEQIKSNREALDQELAKLTPDMNKINDLQSQWKTLQSQMADNRLNSTLEVKKILTPEQFTKFFDLKKEHKFGGRSHGMRSEHKDRRDMCGSCEHRWNQHKDRRHHKYSEDEQASE